MGRNAVLAAGWPETVPATSVDRQCGSSQQAIHFVAASLIAGHYDIAIAGGVESMTRIPIMCTVEQGPGDPHSPLIEQRYHDTLVHQGVGAEMIAEKWKLTRSDVDSLSNDSHRKAQEAIDSGRFDDEIVPIEVPDGQSVSHDGCVRPGTTVEILAGLKPAFQVDGVVTAGNSSQISDGSAALLMMTSGHARDLGLEPIARVHSVSLVGVDPVTMLTGPIPATSKVLARSGLRLEDIGAFEINEAFASVIGAWLAEYPVDPAKLNPNGGAVALGHPLGASWRPLGHNSSPPHAPRGASLRPPIDVRGRRHGQRDDIRACLRHPTAVRN